VSLRFDSAIWHRRTDHVLTADTLAFYRFSTLLDVVLLPFQRLDHRNAFVRVKDDVAFLPLADHQVRKRRAGSIDDVVTDFVAHFEPEVIAALDPMFFSPKKEPCLAF
jgi:hypothetical protein